MQDQGLFGLPALVTVSYRCVYPISLYSLCYKWNSVETILWHLRARACRVCSVVMTSLAMMSMTSLSVKLSFLAYKFYTTARFVVE